jgi:hypothetical protein
MADIDNISITYSDTIDNVEINYLSTVDNITLNIGDGIVSSTGVTAVNSLTGDVVLTASAELTLTTASNGYYNHIFTHNLNYQYVDITLYDTNNFQVISDVIYEDPDYVNIRAAIDLTGYKAVAQR